MLILPTQRGLTILAVNIGHRMKPRKKNPLLCRSAAYVEDLVEQVGSTLTALERLGYEVVVAGQMGTAMYAAVFPVG